MVYYSNARHLAGLIWQRIKAGHWHQQKKRTMKKHEIEALQENNRVDSVKIVRSPSDAREWVVLFKEIEGKSFFLISDDDQVCSHVTLDAAVEALDAMGFARAEVLF